jgi:hypothetical protein
MAVNTEKYRRMATRRAIGLRDLLRERPGVAPAESYLVAHTCFACRKSFKVHPRHGFVAKCPQCGGVMYAMGRSFKAPRKNDKEQWLKVQALYSHGFRFFSYRSFPEAPKLPERRKDIEAFVAAYPNHPFRASAPNKALQSTSPLTRRLSFVVRRRNASIEMTPTEFPITQELWQVACARGVKREQLRRVLGSPHFIETNSRATYGGEEDWWGYEVASGELAVLCLRVPYQDAVLLSNKRVMTSSAAEAFNAAFKLGILEVYESAYPA